MEWLLVFGPFGPGDTSSLTHWTKLVHNLGILLDSWLLLDEKVVTVGREGWAFHRFIFCPTVLFPGPGGLAHDHSCLGHFLFGLLQHALYKAALEDHLEVTTGQECSGTHSVGHS